MAAAPREAKEAAEGQAAVETEDERVGRREVVKVVGRAAVRAAVAMAAADLAAAATAAETAAAMAAAVRAMVSVAEHSAGHQVAACSSSRLHHSRYLHSLSQLRQRW